MARALSRCTVLFAVLKQATDATSMSGFPYFGLAPWLAVILWAVAIAIGLWLLAKLLKLAIWIAIILVLVGGVLLAARMLLNL